MSNFSFVHAAMQLGLLSCLLSLGSGCRDSSSTVSTTAPAPGGDGNVEGPATDAGDGGAGADGTGEGGAGADGESDGERTPGGPDTNVEAPGKNEGPCSAAADPLSETSLMATVEALASPDLGGRYPGTPGDTAARALIEARFKCLGLEPPGGSFEQSFKTEDGEVTANVLGVMRGSDPEVAGEVIVVGAHHDHLGEDDEGIYHGANDDASGVAAVLGLAEKLARQEKSPRRTVVFAAFGAEEAGYLGSIHYGAHPIEGLSLDDTVFMINLDMIGSYKSENTLYALHTFPGTPGREILDGVLGDFKDLKVDLGSPGELADHLTFCEAGVPVTFFHTSDDGCYHKPCDEADRIDRGSYVRIVQLVWALLSEATDGETDLAASRAKGCGDQ